MSMRVYSKDLYKDVAKAAADGEREYEFYKTREVRSISQPRTGKNYAQTEKLQQTEKVTLARQRRLQKTQEAKQRETEEDLQRSKDVRAATQERQDRRFHKMLAHLDSEKHFANEMTEYLGVREQSEKRSKQALYKDWCKNVYNPIQRDIRAELDKTPTAELERRRREAFAEYIDTVNRKQGVFRDIIIEHDYDPLKQRALVPKYNSSKYKAVDPLIKDQTQIEHETALIASMDPTYKPIVHQPRESLDLLLWGKLESTPYIRYSTEKQVRHKREVPGAAERRASTLQLDHYRVPKDPELVKRQYFPGGKLIPPPHPYAVRKDNMLYHHEQ